MRRLLFRARSESGQALISSLILLAGVLIPLLFLVPLFARVEQGRLAAEQAARDAVRAARHRHRLRPRSPLRRRSRARGSKQESHSSSCSRASSPARASSAPACEPRSTSHESRLFGSIGTVEVSGDAAAPVDRYRSLLGSPSP